MREHQPILLFLHIPKAAGTTLSSLCFEQMRNLEASDCGIRGMHSGVFYHPATFVKDSDAASEALVQQALRHDALRAIVGHFEFGIHAGLQRSHRYVTMLRQPVSRVRSLYEFQRLNEAKYGALAGIRLPDEMDLSRYVLDPPYAEVDNGMVRRLSGQSPPIGECSHSMLELAKKNLERHSFVLGLAERFDDSLILIAHQFGWKETPVYYPKNVNVRAAEKSVLDPVEMELIRKRNELDEELYRFAAELFDRQIAAMGDAFAERKHEYEARTSAWYAQRGLSQPQLL